VARQLESLLRRGGALYGFFGTTAMDLKHYTRYVVDRENRFQLRPYPAMPTKRNVLVTRDINNMFDRLILADSVLLKSGTRETLFRRRPDRFVPPAPGDGLQAGPELRYRRSYGERPTIALLSDFGTRDHYAGVMKGVVLSICPDAVLVDISHDLRS
jgi:hypothetical protein